MSILNELNEFQREAASTVDGALLILAGAGSGKTRTITYRIAHMVNECGISPYKILAVTFTNKAAKEMKERVERLIGHDAEKTTVSTFHSFGLRLLRVYAKEIGYDSNFTIYDIDDQKRVVKNIAKELTITDKKLTEGMIASIISKLKEDSISPDEYEKENQFLTNSKVIAEVYRRYNSEIKRNNGMDFSDILVNTYKLLCKSDILEKIQEKYRYIMVDEYQDTNEIQYKIIKTIASKYGNICVVGDENQSIYGFRGANIKNILNFEKDYENAKVVKLEENYRSTSTILEAANCVIRNNKTSRDKKLWTKKVTGDKIIFELCEDGRSEATYVFNKIKELRRDGGYALKDITILYRTNAQSRSFEEIFLRNGISYKVFGGMQFYQRAEIKDILSYLSFVNNSRDSLSLSRIINVPKRKIGDVTLKKILDFASSKDINLFEALGRIDEVSGIGAATVTAIKGFMEIITKVQVMLAEYSKVSEIFEVLVREINYKDYLQKEYPDDYEGRCENLEELGNSITEYEKIFENITLQEYLENVALVSATDKLQDDSDYVKLMTIHNSKGLEFPVVFLTGLEDEIFPGKNADFDNNVLEEERRLAYVAITRAEEKLILSSSLKRFMYGDTSFRSPSRFIDEIPFELLQTKASQRDATNQARGGMRPIVSSNKLDANGQPKVSLDNLNLKREPGKVYPFKKGEKVTHRKFGLGVVRDINDRVVVVEFLEGKREIAAVLAEKFLIKNN